MVQRLVLAILMFSQSALAQKMAFDQANVELIGDDTAVVTHHGREAIQMRSGFAIWPDVSFEDGTIEVDIETVGLRAFVYLTFRMQSRNELEELYFRTHKPMHPDFIQYSPVYRRESNWQLYHGAGYTAAAPMPSNEWVHVKVVVSGRQAAVFVANAREPQIVIPLEREPMPGYIALRSFFPDGQEHTGPVTYFSNLEVRPGEVDYDFPPVPAVASLPGTVKAWKLSESFEAPSDGGLVNTLPKPTTWTRVASDASGLVVLLKHIARPEGSRRSTALAKLDLRAARAETVRFDFGYSDEVSVFLNGRLLFSADDSYSFNFPRRQGLIGVGQATLHLPLEAGDNELILALTDRFGGWGVMGRLHETNDVTLVP